MFHVIKAKSNISPTYDYFWGTSLDELYQDLEDTYEEYPHIVTIYSFKDTEEFFDSDLEEYIKTNSDALLDMMYSTMDNFVNYPKAEEWILLEREILNAVETGEVETIRKTFIELYNN